MRGLLPKAVLSRDKTPVCRDPEAIALLKYGLPALSRDGPILRYIDLAKVPNIPPGENMIYSLINVFVLDYWLKSRQEVERPITLRDSDGT
jgi:hypothetical protein